MRKDRAKKPWGIVPRLSGVATPMAWPPPSFNDIWCAWPKLKSINSSKP